MAFTAEQQYAIDSTGKDILVSAAAGSGKTTILVERIIKMLIDESNPVSIDTILITTFSKAATAEMRKRISDALKKAVNANPKNILLRRQLSLINKASITTIDAFFNSVVKKYFKNADIDPDFRIGDAYELEALSSKALNDYFEELYKKEDSEFLYLVDAYSAKPEKDTLEDIIKEISNKTENIISLEKWFEKSLDNFKIFSVDEYFNSEIFKSIKEEGRRLAQSWEDYLSEMMRLYKLFNLEYANYINKDFENCLTFKSLINGNDEEGFCRFAGQILQKGFFPSARNRKGLPEDVAQSISAYRGVYKNSLTKYAEYFSRTPEQYIEEYSQLYRITKKIAELTLTYKKRLFELKKEKSVFSFTDITHLCYKILIDEKGRPTEAAKDYRKRFSHIIIDEFQDSNYLQDAILTAISGKSDGRPNMFMVGDLKQSIYKFRSAEPSMFSEKYDNFKASASGMEEKIDLNKNFRSRKCVIDCINFVFSRLMSKEIGGTDYDAASMLYAGADFPLPSKNDTNYSDCCELHILNTKEIESDADNTNITNALNELNDYKKAELEAAFISNRINDLINVEKIHIYDSKNNLYRAAEFRDFVILMRSKTKMETFSDILSRNAVPSFFQGSSGLFDALEVKTIMSLLAVIDNPYQDIEMIAVLHSPIYFISADELIKIRTASKETYFYSAVKAYTEGDENNDSLKEKLIGFIADLKRWSELTLSKTISELLFILYNETNYYNYVGMLENGKTRRENLDNLCSRAKKFEDSGFNGIFKFITYAEEIKSSGGGKDELIAPESENIVNIMTIHKSKGLEFPFVFIAELEAPIKIRELNANFLIHNKLGFAAKINTFASEGDYSTEEAEILKGFSPRISYTPQYYNFVSNKMYNEIISEEMRILYVALTRAKEKLILVGALNLDSDELKKNMAGIFPSKKEIDPAALNNNFLDWIIKAFSRHPMNNALKLSSDSFNIEFDDADFKFCVKTVDRNELVIKKLQNDIRLDECFKKLEALDSHKDYSGRRKKIFSLLSYKYPYERDLTLPSTVSISEIKRNYMQYIQTEEQADTFVFYKPETEEKNDAAETAQSTDFPLPEFYSSKAAAYTGAFGGTALHTVMEHIDFNLKTYEEVNALLKALRSKNIISEEQMKAVNIGKIINFLNSELCRRIRGSNRVFRETPFVMGMQPDEIYKNENNISSDATILVHGIIDLYFEEDNGIVLVDYKTDRVKSIAKIIEKYSLQLELYKRVLEKNTGKPVKESVLYLFGIDKSVNL